MASQKWRERYAYIRPYALQSKSVVYHALPAEGPYYPPRCIGGDGSYSGPILVRVEHMKAIGAKPCRRCHSEIRGRLPGEGGAVPGPDRPASNTERSHD